MTFSEDLENALEVLRRGGIILYPTDTIWGIGCDATDPEAVDRIFRLKRRADSKSMLSLVGDREQLSEWVERIPEAAFRAMEEASGPLTVIYDSPRGIANALRAEDGSAGFRISGERFSAELARRLGAPLVSTSANISGKPAACVFGDIDPDIIAGVDYVCTTGRDNPSGKSSSIIKISGEKIIRIR